MTGEPLLRLENLSTHYVSSQGTRVVRAVDGVSLSLRAGETLGIVGESGSGKSTLALTILRVLPPAARIVGGRMLFEGEDLVTKSDAEMRDIRGKRIAMILQDPMASLNPLFTIGNQVAEPIQVHEKASRSIQAQYLNLLRELQREHGLALIFITHNLGIVAKMCDQLAVMYAGRLVESGPVSRIFNEPAHPYTKALLNSIPRMSDRGRRLTAIAGQPPDLATLGRGCAFAPRCPQAFDRCRAEAPPAIDVGDGRIARCWLAAGAGAEQSAAAGGL